jgi:hypothetical protein
MFGDFIDRANSAAEELNSTPNPDFSLIARFLTDAQNVATADIVNDDVVIIFGDTLDSVASERGYKINNKEREMYCNQFRKGLRNMYDGAVELDQKRSEWTTKVEDTLQKIGWKP